MHAHCFPGARVLDVSTQIPTILKDDESVAAVVIHMGVKDTKLRQTETLKRGLQEPDQDGTEYITRDDNQNYKLLASCKIKAVSHC